MLTQLTRTELMPTRLTLAQLMLTQLTLTQLTLTQLTLTRLTSADGVLRRSPSLRLCQRSDTRFALLQLLSTGAIKIQRFGRDG